MENKAVRFGKYVLLHRIAIGGMAEIFLARQEGLEGFEKNICIKRIRPHLSKEPNFIRMFLNEAKLAAGLNHPNIVQIYDLGRIRDSYFIAMEYVAGCDMSRVIPVAEKKNIPFPLIYALKIISSCCEGLYYAHTKQDAFGHNLDIVHRDVSPENIIVGFNGVVKVADFGIAKANSQLGETKVGEIKGKLSYMSPEQAKGEILDQRSDVFALGAVLYEWLTAHKLFSGENEMAILKSIIDGEIYPPSYFKADIPKEVERILMKSLAKDRNLRYQSAFEMQRDIDAYIASCEFSPSNIHLSNFMKQLFAEKVEQDQQMQRQWKNLSMNASDVIEVESDSDAIWELEQLGGEEYQPVASFERMKKQKLDGAELYKVEVCLTSAQWLSLTNSAERNGLNQEKLILELVKDHLKWR